LSFQLQPMGTEDLLYSVRVVFFISLLFFAFQLSRPESSSALEEARLPSTAETGSVDWTSPTQWQKEASKKAIVKYAQSQEKKWRRWNEAMFERSGDADKGEENTLPGR
jgi:hypothetical protein